MSAKHITGRFGLATGKGTVGDEGNGRYVVVPAFRRFRYLNSKVLVVNKRKPSKEAVFDAATAVEMLENPQAPNAELLSILAAD